MSSRISIAWVEKRSRKRARERCWNKCLMNADAIAHASFSEIAIFDVIFFLKESVSKLNNVGSRCWSNISTKSLVICYWLNWDSESMISHVNSSISSPLRPPLPFFSSSFIKKQLSYNSREGIEKKLRRWKLRRWDEWMDGWGLLKLWKLMAGIERDEDGEKRRW